MSEPTTNRKQLELFETGDRERRRVSAPATASADPVPPPRFVGAADPDAHTLATASRLPATVHLGTSSWSFPGWAGIVYDRIAETSELSRGGLAAYSEHPVLRCVGVDRTYYAPVNADTLRVYRDSVPENFRFIVKAFEGITTIRFAHHPRYRDHSGQRSDFFLDPAYAAEAVIGPARAGLGEKLGMILFQFPPQDLEEIGGPARFLDELGQFLRCLPAEVPYAVEVRNRDLLSPRYRDLLAESSATHCFSVHPRLPDLLTQAELISPGSGPALLVRWNLGQGREYEASKERYQPFDRLVDEDPRIRGTIASLALEVARAERPVYVVANNKAEGSAPLTLMKLAESIASHC